MSAFTPNLFLQSSPVVELLYSIRQRTTYLRKDARIVFVCGANSTENLISNRETFLDYADKHFPEFRFFKAEEVFEAIESSTENDLLSIEDDLGKFSDCIILVCESESAFAELGAFALSQKLAKQLLIINDQRHAASHSFINLGPIKKSDRVSNFKPAIFTDFSAILRSASEIKERLHRIPHKKRQAVEISEVQFNRIERKLRLLLIADLINLLGPISLGELVAFTKEFSTSNSIHLSTELALGIGLGLFREFRDKDTHRFFFHSTNETTHLFDYSGINRASIRSSIYRIYRQRHRVRLENLQREVFQK